MKYFTEEFIRYTRLDIPNKFRLTRSRKVAVFSQKVFEKLYSKKFKEHIKWKKKIKKDTLKGCAYDEAEVKEEQDAFRERYSDLLTEEELLSKINLIEKNHLEFCKEAIYGFTENGIKEEFEAEFYEKIKLYDDLVLLVPQLKTVDKRYFALGFVTFNVYKLLLEEEKQQRELSEQKYAEYNEYFKTIRDNLPKDCENLRFHHGEVICVKQVGNNYVVAIEEDFYFIKRLIFKNAQLLSECVDFKENMFSLIACEVYLNDGNGEFFTTHILVEDEENDKYREIVIKASDLVTEEVELDWN